MDFARKQLEKYGWTDGKGLGKHENGISQALKPKLKRSVTGIGHDAAAEFTEHWWTKLYNTAAKNLEVKEKNGKTKKIKTKDDEFEITNLSWTYKKNNKSKSKEEYTNFFVKTSILTKGGVKTEDLQERESVTESDNSKVDKLTDEELFAACGGRTAHKGARHGLKALGKLARIEMQEQILLQQSKYNGYSKVKCKEKNDEDFNEHHGVVHVVNKKIRKKRHCPLSGSEVNDNNKKVTELEKNLYKKSPISNADDLKCKKKHSLSHNQESNVNLENTQLKVRKYKLKQKLNYLDTQESSSRDESNIVTVKANRNETEYVKYSEPIPKKRKKKV